MELLFRRSGQWIHPLDRELVRQLRNLREPLSWIEMVSVDGLEAEALTASTRATATAILAG